MKRQAPTDAAELLATLLAAGDGRVAARAYGGLQAASVAVLIAGGLLVSDGVLDTVICDACNEPHLAEVTFDTSRDCRGWHCPEAGFVKATPEEIAALAFSTGRVAAALADAFAVAFGRGRGRPRQLEETAAWFIGTWPISGRWTTVVMVRPPPNMADARRVSAALSALPTAEAGLVLHVDSASTFEPPPPFLAASFETYVLFDDGRHLHVDAKSVTALLARAVALHVSPGRPTIVDKVHGILDALLARGRVRRSLEGPRGDCEACMAGIPSGRTMPIGFDPSAPRQNMAGAA